MKSFQALCLGFDPFVGKHIPRGTSCVIRLDSTGLIQLVSADGHRFKEPGLTLNGYELHEYFKLGHSAPVV